MRYLEMEMNFLICILIQHTTKSSDYYDQFGWYRVVVAYFGQHSDKTIYRLVLRASSSQLITMGAITILNSATFTDNHLNRRKLDDFIIYYFHSDFRSLHPVTSCAQVEERKASVCPNKCTRCICDSAFESLPSQHHIVPTHRPPPVGRRRQRLLQVLLLGEPKTHLTFRIHLYGFYYTARAHTLAAQSSVSQRARFNTNAGRTIGCRHPDPTTGHTRVLNIFLSSPVRGHTGNRFGLGVFHVFGLHTPRHQHTERERVPQRKTPTYDSNAKRL